MLAVAISTRRLSWLSSFFIHSNKLGKLFTDSTNNVDQPFTDFDRIVSTSDRNVHHYQIDTQ